MSLNRRMSQHHERSVAEFLGGRVCPGSGNHFANQMDVRQSRMHQEFAFAVDCKATRSASVSVSRAMWNKAVEQAGGERPMLALRLYTSDRLDYDIDLVVIKWDDFLELLERLSELVEGSA